MHFVYIVRCADGSLYTGYARDLQARVKAHNAGRGAKYTSARRPVRLVYAEVCESLGAALRREHAIKQLPRARKQRLCQRPEARCQVPDARYQMPGTRGKARSPKPEARSLKPEARSLKPEA